jgi:hypothetical protein
MKGWISQIKQFTQRQFIGEMLLAQGPFILLLLQVVLLLPDQRILWGSENVFYRYGHTDGLLSNVILRLYYQPQLYHPILITHIVSCLLAVLPASLALVPRTLAWISALMLYAAAPSVYGWAMPILLLTTFASIGMCLTTAFFNRLHLRYWLMVFLRAQALVFTFAFVAMAWGNTQWLHGEAFYYAIHHDAAVRSWVIENREGLSLLSSPITYCALLFASLFLVMICFEKTRRVGFLISLGFIGIYGIVFNDVMNTLVLAQLLLPWGIALAPRT